MSKNSYQVSFAVSRERCQDIMTSAVEAGVHGAAWLRDYDADCDYDSYGVSKIRLHTRDGKTYDQVPYLGEITPENIAGALGEMLDHKTVNSAQAYAAQALGDNLDGPSADVVLQFAAFRKHVYA